MAPPRPTEAAPGASAAGRVSVTDEAGHIVVRCDVRAATVRYADGVFELWLPKALLPPRASPAK